MANATGVSRFHSVAYTRSSRSCTSSGPAQRSCHDPAAPPPLALSAHPHRVLPHRAARPAHNRVLSPPRATNNTTNEG
eukprot:6194624-Pleurochrysis_carterae.AAC.1